MAQNLSNSSDLVYTVDTHLSLSNEDLIKAIWVSILIVVGVTGNLLTLLAIPYAKFKQRIMVVNWPMTVFILNLAFADLLYCSINLPIYVAHELQYEWKWNLPFCQFIANIRYSNAYADWMSLAMIALCLNFNITKPRKETILSSRRNRILILVFIRLYGFILLMPTNFGIHGEFGFKENDAQNYCVLLPGTLRFPPTLAIYITAFAFPAIIIVISYGHICYFVWKNNKYFKKPTILLRTNIERREKKLNWTLFMVSFIFILLVSPRVIYTFLYGSMHASGFSSKKDPWLDLVLYCIYWCQYAINFFIYVVRIKAYRSAYIFFLKEMKNKLMSLFVNGIFNTGESIKRRNYQPRAASSTVNPAYEIEADNSEG